MSKSTNGKGDSPRNCFSQKFRDNYDTIFGNKNHENSRDTKKSKGLGEQTSEGASLPSGE